MANANPKINPHLISQTQWLLHDSNKKPICVDGKPRGVYPDRVKRPLDCPEDRARWATYEQARAYQKKHPHLGLGFAVADGFQLLDLDDVFDPLTGKALVPWLDDLLRDARALGAYIETSMSGRGFHVIGFGPVSAGVKRGHAESYCFKRYCAMGTPVYTGLPKLPDITPLLQRLGLTKPLFKQPPALRLVQPGYVPVTWPGDRDTILAKLPVLNPDMDRDDWIKVGMAIHTACGGSEEGLAIWDEWSAEATRTQHDGTPTYQPGECARQWRSFQAGAGVGVGTLVYMANEGVSSPVIPKPRMNGKEFDRKADETTFADLMARKFEPVRWLVDGLVGPGLTILYARPKTGKSYFVLQMGLHVAIGSPFLGRATAKTPVAYFNLEEDAQLVQERGIPISQAMGTMPPGNDFILRTQTSAGAEALADIEDYMNRGYRMVIVDIFARIRDELNENPKANVYARDYDAVAQLKDLAAQHPDTALVVVHHTNKRTDVGHWSDRASGSAGITGGTDTNILMDNLDLRRTDEDSKDTVRRHRLLHWSGKRVGVDNEMMIRQMANGGGWEVSDATEDEVLATSKQQRILAILRESKVTWVPGLELIALLEDGEKPSKAQRERWYQILHRMVKRNLILSDGSGGRGYRLP